MCKDGSRTDRWMNEGLFATKDTSIIYQDRGIICFLLLTPETPVPLDPLKPLYPKDPRNPNTNFSLFSVHDFISNRVYTVNCIYTL